MSNKFGKISQINLVARHFDETLKFYRLLGLDIAEPIAQPPGTLHATANEVNGVQFEMDNVNLARIYNAAWRRPSGNSSLMLSVLLESRDEVDDTYMRLVDAGYEGHQPPYDAFWGSRFAIVADPEGNDVGLMSPADVQFKSWPPVDSPEV